MSKYHSAVTKLAKHISIPPDMERIIVEIVDWFQESVHANKTILPIEAQEWYPTPEYRFENPRTGQPSQLGIEISVDISGSASARHLSMFEIDGQGSRQVAHWTIRLNPENFIRIGPKGIVSVLRDRLRRSLRHEFGHILDPKTQMDKFRKEYIRYKDDPEGYMRNPMEFDAFSTEYAHELQANFTSGRDDPERVLEWLRTGDEQFFPPSMLYSGMLEYWNAIRDDKLLARRFRQRIFGVAQQEKQRLQEAPGSQSA